MLKPLEFAAWGVEWHKNRQQQTTDGHSNLQTESA